MNGRLDRLRAEMAARGLEAMLVSSPENRRYVSGFTGTSANVLVTADRALVITDFRYTQQAKAQCTGFEVVQQQASHAGAFLELLAEVVQSLGVKAVGFEQDYLTYGEVERYRALEKTVPGFTWVPVSGVVERLRIVKDEAEIAILEEAARIADEAFEHVLGVLRPGLTERDVALELEIQMRKRGASGAAFDTIVASGWRSAMPHGVASDKVLEAGDLVTMDFGALYQGYCSDLTRTVVIGKANPRQREIYERVLEAQRLALAAVRPGTTGRELDAVARDALARHGLAEAFGHSLGHGIGLAIHEDPRISKSGEDVLEPGMVITIEPGVYLPEWGGVRIEEDVLVTPDGGRVLTHSAKDTLIEV
ncbi:MAG: Xaa-Pro peptidase family protein [Alicyclobacillus macrosporangiidus]|uniref:M24 family metallopeptidase n=1 Tax=Alicyclobacillus macrosporangiidus TaxID=392015 RepID=UPI0026EFE5A1|nr:Xaa-Pro peptidase family protein [Alicyclobacillus macrosporangiidus]MCL6598452.1 Xaa-Pro peptidase family protein [Alicyclobacillus macrosporangiidus]